LFHGRHAIVSLLLLLLGWVQHQVFDGFLCELSRRNYTILNSEIQLHPDRKNDYAMKSITTLKVASPNWQQQENQNVTIKLFFQYRPKFTMEEVHNESIIPILEGGTDILFFNFGLHWPRKNRQTYTELMLTTMTALKQHAVGSGKVSLFAFRETSAQHFDTPLGDWPKPQPLYNCTPLDTTSPLFGWRNRDIMDAANKSGFTSFVVDPSGKTPLPPRRLLRDGNKDDEIVPFFVLPFTEFTSEFDDLHPTECTHYCSTPHLWNPLWRSLRLAMDRTFVG
jgi:hypothetical protein